MSVCGGVPVLALLDVPRVVLDSGTRAHRPHHLEVEGGAHLEPLRLEQLVLPVELLEPLPKFELDGVRWRGSCAAWLAT